MDVIAGVYGIFNTVSGKVYIGSSKNVFLRWKSNRIALNNNKHSCKELAEDWDELLFSFVLLERCLRNDRKSLLRKEELWLRKFPATLRYNWISVGMPGARTDPYFQSQMSYRFSILNRGRKKKGNLERDNKICEEYKSGATQVEIAKKFGMAQSHVSYTIRDNGLSPIRKSKLAKLTKEQVIKARKDYEAGRVTQVQLAKRLGIVQSAVSFMLRETNYKWVGESNA